MRCSWHLVEYVPDKPDQVITNSKQSTQDHVIKVNAQLSDVSEFSAWNDVFLDVFDAPYPCRTTVGAALVAGKIEVEIIAAATARR